MPLFEKAQNPARMRFNDGAVDSRGRLWAGTMNDPRKTQTPRPEGTFYRLDGDLTVHRMLEDVYTPNGMAWNAANDKMFWTDSEPQNIYVFDFDAEKGAISNQKVFYHFEFGPGINPDGLVIDVEDCIWTAVWRGGKVLRLSPDGKIIAEIIIPTAFVTCPVFIGTELLITTAKDSRVAEDSVARGGDVYKVDVGVTGPSKHKFRYA
jgi:sugar lactone lactonase YvrE